MAQEKVLELERKYDDVKAVGAADKEKVREEATPNNDVNVVFLLFNTVLTP